MYTRGNRRAFVQGLSSAGAALLVTACGGGGGGGDVGGVGNPPLPAAPVITQQPSALNVPAGGSATFSVTLQDAMGVSYEWSRNGTTIAGATTATYVLPVVTYAEDGSRFAVRAVNAGGAVSSVEVVLNVSVPVGVSMFVPYTRGQVLDLDIDAQGFSYATMPITYTNGAKGMIVRKYAPTGELVPFGIDGLGLVVPGASSPENLRGTSYTGGVLAPSGDFFVSTVSIADAGFNQYRFNGGTLHRVSPSGQITTLVNWPGDSPGAVAPLGLTRGADGTLYFIDYLTSRLMTWTAFGGVTSGPVAPVQTSIYSTRLVRMVVDASNRVYVRDDGTLWRVVAGQVNAIHTNKRSALVGAGAMVLDASGNVYVADTTTISKISLADVVTPVAGLVGSTGVITGALPGNLGRQLGPIALDALGVIQVATTPDGSQTWPTTLLKIRQP